MATKLRCHLQQVPAQMEQLQGCSCQREGAAGVPGPGATGRRGLCPLSLHQSAWKPRGEQRHLHSGTVQTTRHSCPQDWTPVFFAGSNRTCACSLTYERTLGRCCGLLKSLRKELDDRQTDEPYPFFILI